MSEHSPQYVDCPASCAKHGEFVGKAIYLEGRQVTPPHCEQCREEEQAAREAALLRERKVIFVERRGKCDRHGEYTYPIPVVGGKDKGSDPGCDGCKREREEEYRRQCREEDRRRAIARNRSQCGIPQRFRAVSFAGYDVVNEGQREALAKVEKFRDDLLRNRRSGANLILCGTVGAGKTHLACALGNSLLDAGVAVVYRRAYDLVLEVKQAWTDRASEQQILQTYGDLAVLIIDELGSGHGSDTERNELAQIIARRYDNELPTVICGNLNHAALTQVLGARAVDRLFETGATVVVFDWQSYRQRPVPMESATAEPAGSIQ